MFFKRQSIRCLLMLAVCSALTARISAADEVSIRLKFVDQKQQPHTLEGCQLIEAKDGGVLLLGRDGRLWNVTPERIQNRTVLETPFRPLSLDEMGEQLKRELGDGFEFITTKHYVICTNAGEKYAHWCGRLFERFYAAFRRHWNGPPLKLHEPQLPLAAIVFADQQEFAAYATKDAGPSVADAKGYYSIATNRMVLFDLSANGGKPARNEAELIRRVSRNSYNVATVVHEATHQIAFNNGLHTRYASNPLWLTEGMAMYFETPDLSSRSGWKTIGKVNQLRLRQFKKYVQTRPADSLKTLIAGDQRMVQAQTAGTAYAESWALTYFLIRTHREQYKNYLAHIQSKPRLRFDDAETRIADFEAAFGDDWEKLDKEFLRYLRRK